MLEGFPQIDCPSVMLEGFTTDQGIFKVQTTLLNQKQISGLAFHLISLFFFFYCLAVVYVSFCSLTMGITPRICWFCLVIINSVHIHLLCVSTSAGLPQIRRYLKYKANLRGVPTNLILKMCKST